MALGAFFGPAQAQAEDEEKCTSLGRISEQLQVEGARPVARAIAADGRTLVTVWVTPTGEWVMLATQAGPKLCTKAGVYGHSWTTEPWTPPGLGL